MSDFLHLCSAFSLLLICAQTGVAQVPSQHPEGNGGPPGRVILDEQVLASWRPDAGSGLLGPKIELKSLDTSNWVLKDSDSAIARAERVLGIGRGAYPATAELIAVLDDDTPFLTQYVLERPFWQVVLREWTLELPSAPSESRDPYVRTFDVLVRPEDGRVVRIRSRWPKEEPPMPPEPGAGSATCQIYRSGYTVYHGFPKSDPRVSFLETLDLLQKRGEQTLSAKQISARYVVYSDITCETPRPVWAITVRGVFPAFPSPGMPIKQTYEYRLVVDAETGKFLGGSNRPQPDQVIKNQVGK